jgi:Zn-dependent protease
VLLAVFNMIPIPPLDGGNVLAGCCRVAGAHLQSDSAVRFLLLYALILTGGFDSLVVPPYRFILSWLPTQ